MNPKVLKAAQALASRAERDGQTCTLASASDVAKLAGDLGAHLPKWYGELLAAVPLVGLELGVAAPESSDSDDVNWILWLGADGITSESRELYPGSALLTHGYVCVGGCAHGSGDQYFLNVNAGDDPPLVQIYHDIGTDADAILREGVVTIAPSLSAFFANAKTQ